jgi:hypothetical protein
MHPLKFPIDCIASDFSGALFNNRLQVIGNGDIVLLEDIPSNTYELFVTFDNRSYRLGAYNISGKKCQKEAGSDDHTFAVDIDRAALTRIHSLLKNSHHLSLKISSKEKSFDAVTIKQKNLDAVPFFICETTEDSSLAEGQKLSCQFDLLNLTFEVESEVIFAEKNSIAISLPTKGFRKFRRHTPRFHTDIKFQISIDDGFFEDVHTIDISQMGMRFVHHNKNKVIKKWTEICVRFMDNQSNTQTMWRALVIDDSKKGVGILFSSSEETKSRFFTISNEQISDGYSTRESPGDAWSCLEKSGYTKLLSGGILETIKSDCLAAWEVAKNDANCVQPVIYHDKKAIGTIGTVKDRHNHWTPHSLGTQVSPEHLDVTAFLYYSWPIYQLMDANPSWFSTYYDADKKWHNRFYQVFLDEQSTRQGIVTYTRNWYWCNETSEYPTDIEITNIINASDTLRKTAVSLWEQRYSSLPKTPSLSGDTAEFGDFQHSLEIFHRGGIVLAISKSINAKRQLNPFSVFNAMHINTFNEDIKGSEKNLQNLLRAAIAHQASLGIGKAAFTLDFDAQTDHQSIPNLYYFCKAKCLSATSLHIPALISNDVLCFEEMKARQRMTE